ncbi:MAG: bifunctional tRNA (5-methylaminomethyl-2-thiouridine)(34)-methyltransferase MnmD/FAD-dependent 5-carboxymethylaminomethyl-2-thiouridine(34) oxidoreductase MnmC [Pseudohongiellaceae bacterium]
MQIENARLDWIESDLPRSSQYDDVYFSRDDEIAESRHVFLAGNNLEARWCAASDPTCFTLGELGLGSGLNLLLTWQLWRQCFPEPGARRLHYIAFELHPPRFQDLQRLHARWPQLAEYSNVFLRNYPDHSAGCHRLWLDNDVLLDIHYGDATTSLSELLPGVSGQVDCWFADGFSPAHNPQLWQEPLWQLLASCSRAGTSLSTYSVAGHVRRGLTAAGFTVERQPGHGRKRHMLVAQLHAHRPDSRSESSPELCSEPHSELHIDPEPWFRLPAPTPASRSALVIGAGLAGCSMAHSLARRGWQVTVLEAGQSILAGASGCGQLNLRCHLIGEDSALARFYLHSFLYARRLFNELSATAKQQQRQRFWYDCGLVQLRSAMGVREGKRLTTYIRQLAELYGAAILQPKTSALLSEIAGAALTEDGIYLPLGGYVLPDLLAATLLEHPLISVQRNCPVQDFTCHDGSWQVNANSGQFAAPVLVLCASEAIRQWPQTADLPLQVIRGQNTLLHAPDGRPEASPDSQVRQTLNTVVSGQRTLFPPARQQQTVSATYDRDSAARQPRPEDDAENLRLLGGSFHGAIPAGDSIQSSRVGLRSNTPDHAPLIGPVPDLPAMASAYGDLSRDASTLFREPGAYLPGLYLSAAHASSGLATSTLAADYLASLICGELPPLSRAARDSLNPARFLIRKLKKQQPGDQAAGKKTAARKKYQDQG